MFVDLIENVKLGNDEAVCEMLEHFSPLLKKYSRILNYEDAFDDLTLDFLEITYHLAEMNLRNMSDGAIVRYIHTAMRRRLAYYKHRLSADIYAVPFSCYDQEQLFWLESKQAIYDEYLELLKEDLSATLNSNEIEIIIAVVLMDCRVCDVANRKSVSRQSIYKTKKRALNKLAAKYQRDGIGLYYIV